jgi:hypothetical protein
VKKEELDLKKSRTTTILFKTRRTLERKETATSRESRLISIEDLLRQLPGANVADARAVVEKLISLHT